MNLGLEKTPVLCVTVDEKGHLGFASDQVISLERKTKRKCWAPKSSQVSFLLIYRFHIT